MRNLILLSIIVVLALVGFHIYLEIRTKRFIESLPRLAPEEVRQTFDSAPGTVRTSVNEAEQIEPGEAIADALESSAELKESTAEDYGHTHKLEMASPSTVQNTEENKLSLEMEALFEAFHSLDKESRPVVEELEILKMEHKSGTIRMMEIADALSGVDGTTREALYEELEVVGASQTERGPRVFGLQDEAQRLFEERNILLREYGFSSRDDFFSTHREAYRAWQAEQ